MNGILQNNSQLIKGYLQGSLSKSEEKQLVDWINSSAENLSEFKRVIVETQFSQAHSSESLRVWNTLKMKIANNDAVYAGKKIVFPGWLKIAAIVVIALLSGYFVNQWYQYRSVQLSLNELIVPNGEKAELVMADGTRVFLNSGTRFMYPTNFSAKNREVSISGEAFFEVVKDEAHPFIVETPKFNVKVTGTSFNLNTYSEDEKNSLTLHSGEVIINNKGQEYKVKPGEKYIFNTQTQRSEILLTDLEKSFLWKSGMIVIDDLDLEEIQKLLGRRFGVEIKILNENLKSIRYSGQFKPHETLEEVLNMIKETSPIKFDYEINETKDMIIIK